MRACRCSAHLAETGRDVGSQRLIQERGVRNTSDFEIQHTSPKVRVPRHEPASDLEHGVEISMDDDLQDMGSPMHGDGCEQVLSDDDGLATSMDPRVYSQDSAGELDSEDLTACNRVETVPFRHVSFAETVEMVEFDPAVHAALAPMVGYDTPALNMAYRAHAAPAHMVEYDATLMMAYQVYAAPVPVVEFDATAQTVAHQEHEAPVTVVEYDAPAPIVAHQVHAAPAPVDEYDASAARATPSLVDGPIVKVVHVPQVQVAEKTIEIPQLQTIEKIVDTPEIQTVLSTESLDTAPDLEMAPVERTLRIPLADCEGVVEELSKAMEGFSAVLDEFVENFDKPEGLSAETRSMRAMNTYAVRGPRKNVR